MYFIRIYNSETNKSWKEEFEIIKRLKKNNNSQ